jgi:hypothetical protein
VRLAALTASSLLLAPSLALALGCSSPSPKASQAAAAPAVSASRPFEPGLVMTPGGARVHVAFDATAFAVGAPAVLGWIERSAGAVEGYYGRFPLQDVALQLSASEGHGVSSGRVVMRGGKPLISISLGRSATADDFDSDWRMTHEMVHLAFPSVAEAHHWLEEGLASYVEPIARARSGWLTEDAVWREWLQNMAQGLPQPGDRGLDHTPTWARTYWGGALFCLLADVEIRRRSDNRFELGDALRAILQAGGNIEREWPLMRALGVGDQATRLLVLGELYEQMKDTPVDVDLTDLWDRLGVRLDGATIEYDDDAPLSAVRRALVLGNQPRAAPPS